MDRNRNGLVFNIQKFSLHDGPGIRTVVFLKGCPLQCKWCANPESQSRRIQILWDGSKCINCGRCTAICPEGAVSFLEEGKRFTVDDNKCSECKACAADCPEKALQAEGEWMSAEDVIRKCMQDYDFYEESGGGVTLSGGEAMMQPDFVLDILQGLVNQGVHTAMETTGFAPLKAYQKISGYVDLFLLDFKHWEEKKHKEGTGVSNGLILQNMQYLIAEGKDVLPRIPVIPGYNDAIGDAERFAKTLVSIGAKRAQLLPFHQFGEKKYEMMHQAYAYSDIPPLHEEELEGYRQAMISYGIAAFF